MCIFCLLKVCFPSDQFQPEADDYLTLTLTMKNSVSYLIWLGNFQNLNLAWKEYNSFL